MEFLDSDRFKYGECQCSTLHYRTDPGGGDAWFAVMILQIYTQYHSIYSLKNMSGKVVLYYFNGRGKMEAIRWLLTVAGVQCEEVFFREREQYGKNGAWFQCRETYIAGKYNLYGRDLKERLMIDIYAEGARDMMDMIRLLAVTPPEKRQEKIDSLLVKAKVHSLPALEKALSKSQYLVDGQLSCADVSLFEASLMLEELFPTILASFPNIQAFQKRMKTIPAISKFLLAAKESPDLTRPI